MSKVKDITPEALELFEGDFFGKLIVEFKEKTYRAKSPNAEDNIDEFYEYYPYKIIEKGEGYYLIESYSHLLEENEIKKFTIEGDCYFVPISKWNFNEYFCKIKNEL